MKKTIHALLAFNLAFGMSATSFASTSTEDAINQARALAQVALDETNSKLNAIHSLERQVQKAEDAISRDIKYGVVSAGAIILSVYLLKTNSGDSFSRSFGALQAYVVGASGTAGLAYNLYTLKVNTADLNKFKAELNTKKIELVKIQTDLDLDLQALK